MASDKAMKILLLCLAICTTGVLAGSECPPRHSMYPCSCNSITLSRRKSFTIVTCHWLDRPDSLNRILPALGEMDIDQFRMYDSFWSADLLGADSEAQKVLPPDWLKTVKAKEMAIMDSTLSYCFACQWTGICRNTVTKTFRVVNSTSSDKICSLCETGSGRMPWLGCMLKLEHLELSHGKLKSLTSDFFPLSMIELKILDFSHNQIGKIGTNAFKNVPNMQRLDLSHNLIEHLDHTFGRSTKLKFLDVSHNSITMVGEDLIPMMPELISINLAYNLIVNFTLSDWRAAPPKSLRIVDLRENPIHCDCSLRWLNATLAIHVATPGNCATPDEFKGSRFRVASRHMEERCDRNGHLGTRRARTSKAG